MSVVDWNVRPGTREDAEAAFAVWKASITRRRGRPPTAEGSKRVRNRLVAPSDGLFLVAEDAGRIVGMAWGAGARADDGAGDVIPGVFHLSLMFVDPTRWGEGIGMQLTQATLTVLRSQGMRVIQLWTHEDNIRAQRLYARCGFTRTDRVQPDDECQPMRLWAYTISN